MNIPVTKGTIVRLTLIIVGGLAAFMLLPAVGSGERYDVAAAVLTGTLLAFLISQAADRRRLFIATVYLELNKLRRIYHLSKNLSVMDQRFRAWFTDLHGYLYEYMNFFQGKTVDDYSASNASFRKVSYNIYKIPEVRNAKEIALFEDLLRTTGVVAETRQRVKEIRRARMSAYSWVAVLLMTTGFILVVYLSTGDATASRLASAATAIIALIAIDLLWEVDSLMTESRDIAERYVKNIGKLQLGREDALAE